MSMDNETMGMDNKYAEASSATTMTSSGSSQTMKLSGSGDHRSISSEGRKQQNGTSPVWANGTSKGQTDKTSKSLNKATSTKSLVILLAIFGASVSLLCYVYLMFPELDDVEREHVKVPFNIEDAKELAKVLDRYKDLYYVEVMGGIILVYVFLQTFAIPGSLFLSILSGFLFNFAVALPLVCFCSAVGATLCYSLSQLAGRRLVKRFFPERAQKWTEQIEEHKDNLFNYMLFLRMTPILPNWFINLVAPVIGVPLAPFALGTFFGVAPPSVIAIQAGKTLHTMTSSSDAFSWRSMFILAILAVLSIVPSLFKKKLKSKLA